MYGMDDDYRLSSDICLISLIVSDIRRKRFFDTIQKILFDFDLKKEYKNAPDSIKLTNYPAAASIQKISQLCLIPLNGYNHGNIIFHIGMIYRRIIGRFVYRIAQTVSIVRRVLQKQRMIKLNDFACFDKGKYAQLLSADEAQNVYRNVWHFLYLRKLEHSTTSPARKCQL